MPLTRPHTANSPAAILAFYLLLQCYRNIGISQVAHVLLKLTWNTLAKSKKSNWIFVATEQMVIQSPRHLPVWIFCVFIVAADTLKPLDAVHLSHTPL